MVSDQREHKAWFHSGQPAAQPCSTTQQQASWSIQPVAHHQLNRCPLEQLTPTQYIADLSHAAFSHLQCSNHQSLPLQLHQHMVNSPHACLSLTIGGLRNGSSPHGLEARSWAVDLDSSECLHIVLRYRCSKFVASELFPHAVKHSTCCHDVCMYLWVLFRGWTCTNLCSQPQMHNQRADA